MSGVILPRPADREAVLGFWVSLTLLTGGALAALLSVVGWVFYATGLAVGALAVGALIAGLAKERFVHKVYLLWNRAARGYARLAREALLAIWYYTLFAAVARTGGSTLEKEGSGWSLRKTSSVSAYADLGGAHTDGARAGTLREYYAWAARSGRLWLLFLLPLRLLLMALDPKGSRAAPSDIYTLY